MVIAAANEQIKQCEEEAAYLQTCEPIPNVPNEAVYEEWDDRVERATTTATSLDAECQEAIRGSIAQTRSERVPTSPHDSPFPRVHTLGSDEGNAAKINVHTYIRRRSVVSTRSGGISIAGASMPVSTAGMVQEVNISIPSPIIVKDKEELDEEERQRMARVHESAQSFTKEEWENIRARVEANEELYKRLCGPFRNCAK
ncbi:hypothetical protein Tco_0866309 [Tanacetum coccineum]